MWTLDGHPWLSRPEVSHTCDALIRGHDAFRAWPCGSHDGARPLKQWLLTEQASNAYPNRISVYPLDNVPDACSCAHLNQHSLALMCRVACRVRRAWHCVSFLYKQRWLIIFFRSLDGLVCSKRASCGLIRHATCDSSCPTPSGGTGKKSEVDAAIRPYSFGFHHARAPCQLSPSTNRTTQLLRQTF